MENGAGRIFSGARADVDAYPLEFGGYLLFASLKDETSGDGEAFLRDLAGERLPGAVRVIGRAVKTPGRSLPLAPIWLAPPAEQLIALEHGLRFVVEVDDVLNPGLFLDQSENRKRLMELVAAAGPLGPGEGLLNLFSYTGSFSVAAVAAGAPATTSVDVSGRYLRWEGRNHAANFRDRTERVEPRLVKDDARDFIRRARKRGATYRFVVIDPPTFSRGRGKPFRVREELVPLVRAAVECFPERGDAALLASTNDAGYSDADFRDAMEALARSHGLRVEPGSLTDDFRDTHAKSAWLLRRE